ncbi:hypothetical protein D3C87_1367570 [compost metagenome]
MSAARRWRLWWRVTCMPGLGESMSPAQSAASAIHWRDLWRSTSATLAGNTTAPTTAAHRMPRLISSARAMAISKMAVGLSTAGSATSGSV